MCLSLFDESMQPCRDSRGDSRCFVDSRAFVRRSHLWIIVTPGPITGSVTSGLSICLRQLHDTWIALNIRQAMWRNEPGRDA